MWLILIKFWNFLTLEMNCKILLELILVESTSKYHFWPLLECFLVFIYGEVSLRIAAWDLWLPNIILVSVNMLLSKIISIHKFGIFFGWKRVCIILLFLFVETAHHTCANVTLSVMVMLIHRKQTRSSRRHLNDRQLQETITSEMRGIGHVTL